jgi:pyrroline-5-carboxylate reductase
MTRRIVLAGFGNMGRALAKGWIAAGVDPGSITAVDPDPAARDAAAALGLDAVAVAAEALAPIDVAVLAVKPAEIAAVLKALPPAQLYLSIAAGRSIAEIVAVVGSDKAVVRAMPNTPAAIGQGMTGLCAGERAGAADRATAAALMSAVGAVEWLDDESLMDAVTAVSGSGPAYVFLLIEALTDAGVAAGLAPEVAARLATATVSGAGAYARQSTADAASLRRQVTSPKGTTEAALAVLLDRDAFRKLLGDAVAAAAARSRELREKAGLAPNSRAG